ncbi:beta-ketoacyl synthase N-terminal-like domain-containing protein [Delftia sp. PS-11]|uniref:type I polyketide synthase n=1 Tax=Delftia sp. PS-11 TaxID=2767222 RepID=UPI00245782CD|nr:type I polyketide synthase [Delftia sp. PS-11]KAJ8744653.1 acyltransferase domain-containing protein [Delftia sp. PS-11]
MRAQDPGYSGVEIAIIGMAGRFPGADGVEMFWRNIREGREAVADFSDEALRSQGTAAALLGDPACVKSGVVFEGMDGFDAGFFGYTPREASQIDPQQRIFLESAWQALENAGYDAERLEVPAGVFAGAGANLYLMRHLLPHAQWSGGIAGLIALLNGNAADALCTRVAYKLNLRGPAVTVQTACSTSLAAVHMACQSLLGLECDMALAGGVWLNLMQGAGYLHQPGAILSSDGRCRAFDGRADGTMLGSGAGVAVLKRLDDALRDGDTVHAVIRGSAVNNDGARKIGYNAPSVDGQAEAIRAAHAMAGIDAASIGYVEAHGTGTTLGDPIEVAALTQAFRSSTAQRGYCALGSVKTHIGHLDAAAGIAGLINAVMALKHRTLPPSLHFESANPQIDFAGSPFYVNTQARPWPASLWPRRAGVSSFGMGGTNVHMVLEEAPHPVRSQPSAPCAPAQRLLQLSARTPQALQAAASQLAVHLQQCPDLDLADVAHTLGAGRKRHAHRLAVLAEGLPEAIAALEQTASPARFTGTVLSPQPSLAFLFPGQGAQYPGMARSLHEREPVFRAIVDRCCDTVRALSGMDLRSWLLADASDAQAAQALAQTQATQPALFIVEYALAQLWMSWGLRPDAMLGHSIGEYVAACLAGVFTLDDALDLVVARGRIMQSTEPGAMLAVGLPESALQHWLGLGCDLAAVNAADLCVLSGRPAAIAAAEQGLAGTGVLLRRLQVSHAFHGSLLDPVLADFGHKLRGIPLNPPAIAFVSNLSGRWIRREQAMDPAYWLQHMRGTVRFAQGLDTLLEKPDRILLEVGPGQSLSSLARRHPQAGGRPVLASLAGAGHAQQHSQPAHCLAQLWAAGLEAADAPLLRSAPGARRVPLPGYPFERASHWIPAAGPAPALPSVPAPSGDPGDWLYAPVWQRTAPETPAVGAPSRGCMLLLADAGSELADALARAWAASQSMPLVRIEPGPCHERLDAGRHALRMTERGDWASALAQIVAEAGPVARICHLWSLGVLDDAQATERCLLGPLALAQALESLPAALAPQGLDMLLVTDGLEDVSGTEALQPAKAMLHGPCLVIPQELPGTACRIVDLLAPQDGQAQALAQRLLAEFDAPAQAGVAFRGPHRWSRRYERVQPQAPAAPRLRRGGCYLITGGLGGVGLALARHLAEHWQARLVLLGRTPLPARSQWQALAQDAQTGHGLRDRLRQLLDIERLGGGLCVLAADAASEAQMRHAFGAVRREFGEVHGVIHAAGLAGEGMLADKQAPGVLQVLSPKLQGARALLAALDGQPLDFMLLCSSLAAVAGGLGRIDYAAANACLDALAVAHGHTAGWPLISVGWDGWRGLGMAAGTPMPEGVGIAPEQGAHLFERILSGPVQPHVCVSTTDLEARRHADLAQLLDQALPAVLAATAGALPTQARPGSLASFVAPEGDLETGLAALWSSFLGVDPVGAEDNLFELGGDSLMAIQLLARVRQAYGVEIHPAAMLRTPTVRRLAELVETRLIEEIQSLDAGATSHTAPEPASVSPLYP